MEKVSLFNFIFSIIPRSLVAIYFCLAMLEVNIKKYTFYFSGLFFAMAQWLARAWLPLGVHSFAYAIFLSFLLAYFTKIRFSSTFTIALIYFILLYIFDFFVIYIYNFLTNFSLYDIWSMEVTRVLLSVPASISFIGISILLKKRGQSNISPTFSKLNVNEGLYED